MIGRVMELPLAGSYHTELAAYTALRSGDAGLAAAVDIVLGAFYGGCDVVLSPSAASDARLAALGIDRARRPLGPRRRHRALLAARCGRASRTAACASSTPAGSRARRASTCSPTRSSPPAPATRGSNSYLAGGGPEEDALRARLGGAARFLGWLEGEALARAYADADLFLFCSQTDTFGQVVLEAQASGLPVVAVAAGGPAELIASGRTGVLCPPRASALADAVAGLAASPAARARLARGGEAAARERRWESSLAALAAGWHRAIAALATTRAAGFSAAARGGSAHGVKLLVVTPEPIDAAFLRETLGDEVRGAEVLVALARHEPVQAGVLGVRPRRRDRRGGDRARRTRSSASRRKASTRPGKWENPSRRRPSTTRWPRSPPTAS